MKPYPQMPPLNDEEIKALLEQPLIAKLCSLNPDGTIHIAPVIFKYENGVILIGTQASSRKVRNIRGNKNVSVLIDTSERPFKAVLIYGQAELDSDNAVAKRASIFEKSMPAEQAAKFAQGLARQYAPIIIRVTPERMVSFDYAKHGFVNEAWAD